MNTYTVHALFNGDRHHVVSSHRTLDAAIRAGRAQQRPMPCGNGWGILLTVNGTEPDPETYRAWITGLTVRVYHPDHRPVRISGADPKRYHEHLTEQEAMSRIERAMMIIFLGIKSFSPQNGGIS